MANSDLDDIAFDTTVKIEHAYTVRDHKGGRAQRFARVQVLVREALRQAVDERKPLNNWVLEKWEKLPADVRDLNLSIRAANAVLGMRFPPASVDDLAARTNELFHVPNCGRLTINEITEEIAAYRKEKQGEPDV